MSHCLLVLLLKTVSGIYSRLIDVALVLSFLNAIWYHTVWISHNLFILLWMGIGLFSFGGTFLSIPYNQLSYACPFRQICMDSFIDFLSGSAVNNMPAMPEMLGRCRFNPWIWKMPWRRKRQPTPVFLPGKSLGQRGLECYSPWGCKELDTT